MIPGVSPEEPEGRLLHLSEVRGYLHSFFSTLLCPLALSSMSTLWPREGIFLPCRQVPRVFPLPSSPISQIQLTFCINDHGLGFVQRRLYLFHEFFENLPTERLIGPGVLPEHLNDNVIGHLPDDLSDAGGDLLEDDHKAHCPMAFKDTPWLCK